MKYLLSIVLFVGWVYAGNAQDFPEQPYPPRMVNDFAGILSEAWRQKLETRLTAFNDSTTTQIAVVTVNSLYGYDPDDYAVRLLDLWGIGQKGTDNGILILIKPKTNDESGQAVISVGYGLEAVVPDAIADMIAREMIPSFQENDYGTGIDKATDVLFQLTRREYSAEEYQNRNTENGGGMFPVLLIMIIILIIAYFSGRKGKRRGIRSGGIPFFPTGGGSFSGGGSSGGGFGGFGGGRGGGGGASRSW